MELTGEIIGAGAVALVWVCFEILRYFFQSKETRKEAFISGFGCSVPIPYSAEEWLRQNRIVRTKLGQSEQIISFCEEICAASGIKTRYSCNSFLEDGRPMSTFEDVQPELIAMKALSDVGTVKNPIYTTSNNHRPHFWQRMSLFEETAIALSVDASRKALANWGGDAKQITHIMTTCTSGWREPGIAAAVIKALNLSQDIQKAELNFNGCFCGATCLRLGRDVIRAGGNAVLCVACEIPSCHMDFELTDRDNLVAQSLFADGAAAIILTAETGLWKFTQTGMSVVPESTHLLGLNPPRDEKASGYQMTLHKDVGSTLGQYFRYGHGKELLEKMYNANEVRPALCVHPGGPKILEAIGSVLIELGWHKNALDSSYKSFHSFGNLGAAAMLFVLARRLALNDIEKDTMVMMAFGPGVTVEWATLVRA